MGTRVAPGLILPMINDAKSNAERFAEQRLKVVHVITDLSTGGAEMMLLKIIRSARQNVDHSVISLGTIGTIGPRIEAGGVPVLALGMRSPIRYPLQFLVGLRRLIGHLRSERPDVIQSWMYHANLIALFARIMSGLKISVCWNIRASIPQSGVKLKMRLLLWASAQLSRLASAIIYCSRRSQMQHEAAGFCSIRAVHIPNGFDTEHFKPDSFARNQVRDRLKIGTSSLVIGHVARLTALKDHPSFVAAAAIVSRAFENVVFVMAGRDVPSLAQAFPYLTQTIAELGPRLILLPEYSDVAGLMRAFDVFVLSSSAEGFPNVLGEAMACGVPCVTTDVGDAAEIVGRNDLVAPPQDPQALAGAVIRCLELSEPERRAHAKAARERVLSSYSMGVVARQYMQFWRHCVNRDS